MSNPPGDEPSRLEPQVQVPAEPLTVRDYVVVGLVGLALPAPGIAFGILAQYSGPPHSHPRTFGDFLLAAMIGVALEVLIVGGFVWARDLWRDIDRPHRLF